MRHYIFVFYPDDDAEIAFGRADLEFPHDRDALEAAEDIAHVCQVDVWAGDILIAQIPKREAPAIKEARQR